MSTLESVNRFLKDFRLLLSSPPGRDVHDAGREKNRQALKDLEITRTNRRDAILQLSAQNYHKGPETDRDRPGEVWVFGCVIKNTEVYVKLKISIKGDRQFPLCLSFHPAERPLKYPLRK